MNLANKRAISESYRRHLVDWNIGAARVACVLVAALILGGSVLDWAVHPNEARQFLLYRLITATAAILVFLASYHRSLLGRAKQLFLLPIFLAAACVQVMIQHTDEGYASSYYAGLSLCILGFAITVTLSLLETTLAAAAVICLWIFGALIGERPIQFSPFFSNLFFLGGTASIAVGSTLIRNRVAKREFEARYANELLTERNQQRDRFFANISHELRTPLVALSSTLQMMLDQGIHDPEMRRQLLLRSQDTLDDMLENVNDFLLKMRAERGMVEAQWSRVDIADFMRRTVTLLEPIAKQNGNVLSLDNRLAGALVVNADRAKLKRIVNNLIGNALKFTTDGKVDVILDHTQNHCIVVVQDTGLGIPEDELQTIFEPFVQASNNPLRDVQSTGIGLSLVTDLVALHHGEIEVESKIGKGSRFTVRLPLGDTHVDRSKLDRSEIVANDDRRANFASPSFETLDLTPFSTYEAYRPSILVVDDNPQIVQVLAYILCEHYNLDFARDGQEGLDKVRKSRPDLVISDVMMPRKDGYELLEEIKAHPDLKAIPVILLTAKADRASRIRGFERGADEYLPKPFNNQEVLVRVEGILKRKHLETELVHAEKMISIGQLVAGISHEISNPISYAKNAAESIMTIFEAIKKGKIALDEGVEMMGESLEAVREGTTRVAEMTAALRGFVRQGAQGFKPYNIHLGIESTLQIVSVNNKSSIRVRKRYELESDIECNINQLNQVFMNLLQNAMHAVEDVPNGEISIYTYQAGTSAFIEIRDNGPGIAKDQLARIFDPFFTTKQLGKGTGLGLYICKRIVEEHNGVLRIEGAAGTGVRCAIELPVQRSLRGSSEPELFGSHINLDVADARYPYSR
jgi:signal transduction histidine kinase